MLKVGLTGGIGSGKSELSRFYKKWGAYIFDADKEAKNIIDTNDAAQKEIIAEFDTNILNVENKIDKKKLARVAFQDENHQLRLNSIMHPYVFQEIDKQFDNVSSANKHKIFIVDAALIYESGADTHMDFVIVITSLLRFRAERAMGRGNMTREDFMKRVDLQWPDDDKAQLADFIIPNNSSVEDLEKEAREIFDKLI
jgi:dephospho-CoA kinase|tara:strand:- start:579 stop:1172 length:594 start_codon:yes stop_codon:yes gene_type:complete